MENYNSNPYNSYQQQAQDSGALNWDDEIKEEGGGFTLLPEGDYLFVIKKFDKARYDGGAKIPACPKAIVTFSIYSNDGQCIELQESFLLHKKMEWKLSEFFASVGMKKKDEPVRMLWTPELIGKQGVCKIIVHNYTKDGENKQTNRIDKLYPSYDQPALQPPSQQPQQNWNQYQQSQAYQAPQSYQQPQQNWNQGKF